MGFRLIISVLVLSILSGCDPVDDKLVIINSTDSKIYYTDYRYTFLDSLYDPEMEEMGVSFSYVNYLTEIDSGKTDVPLLHGFGNAWERYITKISENQRLHIFLFDKDTLEKYTWKEVVEGNMYSQRLDFSVEELDKLGWEIHLE